MYQDKLIKIIGKEAYDKAFKCIKDLIINGLSLDRFTDDCYRPSRHEITLFLSAWCKLMGLSPEDYREWLTDYCVDVLSVISSTKPSQIRHSTKSTIKYIHKYDIAFICNCEHNIFKSTCSKDCIIYEKMHETYLLNLEEEKKRIEKYQNTCSEIKSEPVPETISKKQKYKEQFDKAVTCIKEYLDKGHTKKEIAEMLNKEGYKTSTGFKWKPGIVSDIAVKNDWIPEHKKRKKRNKGKINK